MKPHFRSIFNFIALSALTISLLGSAVTVSLVRAADPLCYVDLNATGTNDGTSWVDAYTDLQSAITDSCIEIWVAKGTYLPTTTTNRSISFQLESGTAIYGGFSGTETDRDQRNAATNVTILSGDIGTQGDISDNSYHVVYANLAGSTAILDGFTITEGNANGFATEGLGGGLFNYSSSPTLSNLIFSKNQAKAGGGGVNNRYSSPTITNTIFTENQATEAGAGFGGGLSNESTSDPKLTNVSFINNSAVQGGGGMYNGYSSYSELNNVTFSGNSASGSGGGFYANTGSATFYNVTFSGNSAGNTGGGMFNHIASPTLNYVTFSGNSASSGGAMYNQATSYPIINGGIFWGNTPDQIASTSNSPPQIMDSVLQGGCPASAFCPYGAITADPLLGALTDNGGFTQTISIGAGGSASDTGGIHSACPSTDQRGVPRPGTACDIGAFELDTTTPGVTINQAFGQADPAGTSPIKFTVVFSEPINTATFTNTDISLGGTASATTAVITEVAPNNGTTFEVSVSGMTSNGTVIASITANKVQDYALNNNTASTSTDNQVTYTDVTPPAVTLNQASGQADPTAASPIIFTVIFDEPINVSTFTSSDVTLGGTATGILSGVITEIAPNDATTFEIAVSGMTGSGTVTASIAANTVQDGAGIGNTTSTSTDNTVTYDRQYPTVLATSLLSSYTSLGPSTFTVTFSEDVNNVGNGSNTNDATNPANYLVVEDGSNGVFETVSCVGGLAGDDTMIPVSSVIYAPSSAIVNLSVTPPIGMYRLFVCGTTSIVDLAFNELNGGLSDHTFNFTVNNPGANTGTTNDSGTQTTASSLPKTGFAPNKITTLSAQPATLEYAELGDLWLEIPSLNVKSTIVGVPQNADKTWSVDWLGNDTGWLNGTAFPTWTGNSVLTAHVTNASGLEGPFAALKSLKYGDQVIVHMGGVQYVYEVRETKLSRPYSTSYAFESKQDASYLTLVTCSGYNPLNESYLFRRVVRAVLVSTVSE